MNRCAQKFIAILMLLWLPVFTGSALAATISMQLQQDGCHEVVAPQTMADEMAQHHHHSDESPAAADDHAPCSACGVCHLACSGYMATPAVQLLDTQQPAREATPYLVAFYSFTSAPLVPPPLVTA